MPSRDGGRPRAMTIRTIVVVALALAAVAVLGDVAEARPWHRGWPGHHYRYWGGYGGWGYPGWWLPPGGYSGPNYVWYVPPPEPDVVLPRKRCAAGRVPARWTKVRKEGREIWQHVMSRCR
jgi:hypothetical protein